MSNHLSQDQISRWILGQISSEEEEHGRNCPRCSAELIRFRKAVSTFQGVMKNWSEKKIVPSLKENPGALVRQTTLRPLLRWALVGLTAAVLVCIPIYQQRDKPESLSESAANIPVPVEATIETNKDVLLMEEVNAHLSRPIPMPMERVMVLFPSEEGQ